MDTLFWRCFLCLICRCVFSLAVDGFGALTSLVLVGGSEQLQVGFKINELCYVCFDRVQVGSAWRTESVAAFVVAHSDWSTAIREQFNTRSDFLHHSPGADAAGFRVYPGIRGENIAAGLRLDGFVHAAWMWRFRMVRLGLWVEAIHEFHLVSEQQWAVTS